MICTVLLLLCAVSSRGSPCEIPEETLEGYQAAFDAGVDFIELDVVSTKDGHLICRHGPTLDDSTDVTNHVEFSDRKRTETMPDGRRVTGFFTADFTLAEIGRLRARQAFDFRDHSFDGKYRIPALADVLALVKSRLEEGKPAGAYIESKEPQYHDRRGLPLEGTLARQLLRSGFSPPKLGRHIVLQSFDTMSLRKMRDELQAASVEEADLPPLTWLFDCDVAPTDAELDSFARFGQGLGPQKALVEDAQPVAACGQSNDTYCGAAGQNCSGALTTRWQKSSSHRPSSDILDRARRRGLYVHPWTVRREARFLPVDFDGNVHRELDYLAGPNGLGVQGVLLDCPAVAAQWLRSHSWNGTTPMLQAAIGTAGSLTGQPLPTSSRVGSSSSGDGGLHLSGEAGWQLAVATLVVLMAIAAGVGFMLWARHRRRKGNRYEVFPEIVMPPDYSDYGREQLSAAGMRVPPSPLLTGDLQLTALPPESPFSLAASWDPGREYDLLMQPSPLPRP